MLFKWRRDLHAGPADRVEFAVDAYAARRGAAPRPCRTSTRPIVNEFFEIVVADAVVRVGVGTDEDLLQLILHSLRA